MSDEELRDMVIQLAETTKEALEAMREGFQRMDDRFNAVDKEFYDIRVYLDGALAQLTLHILDVRDGYDD